MGGAPRRGTRRLVGPLPLELVQFARAYEGWDFYVQPNPSSKPYGKRCSAEDVDHWHWFLVDIDPIGRPVPGKEKAAEEVIDALQAYAGKRYAPYWIDSGRGIQLWFLLEVYGISLADRPTYELRFVDMWDEPSVKVKTAIPIRHAISAATKYWLSQLNSRITNPAFVIDPSVSDLPRLMRCPGTVNRKTGAMASFMAKGTPCAGLAEKLLDYTPAEKMTVRAAVMDLAASLPDDAPWQAAASTLTLAAMNFITLGATEPGRHSACAAAARSLAESGISEVEVLKALTLGAKKCRPEIDDAAYLERTAREAMAFGRKAVDKA